MYSTFNPSSYRPTQAPATVPANYTYDSKYGNDFVKVWAACVAKQTPNPTHALPIQRKRYQTPNHDTNLAERPPIPIGSRPSLWSRAATTGSFPMARQIPTASTSQAPEPTLHHNDTLESPITIQPGQRRPVNDRYPLDIPQASLIHTTPSPPENIPQASLIHTTPSPPEDTFLHTPGRPPVDERVVRPKQQGMLPKVGDGFHRMKLGDDGQEKVGIDVLVDEQSAFQTPAPAVEPLPQQVQAAAAALYRMYRDPETDYTEPSQAMLAITLMNALPFNADLKIRDASSHASWNEGDLIKNLVEQYTMAIYSKAIERRDNGEMVKVGAAAMLWELHYTSRRRWGELSLLAEHTEVLAKSLDNGSP